MYVEKSVPHICTLIHVEMSLISKEGTFFRLSFIWGNFIVCRLLYTFRVRSYSSSVASSSPWSFTHLQTHGQSTNDCPTYVRSPGEGSNRKNLSHIHTSWPFEADFIILDVNPCQILFMRLTQFKNAEIFSRTLFRTILYLMSLQNILKYWFCVN